jgi:hypothetical protein
MAKKKALTGSDVLQRQAMSQSFRDWCKKEGCEPSVAAAEAFAGYYTSHGFAGKMTEREIIIALGYKLPPLY